MNWKSVRGILTAVAIVAVCVLILRPSHQERHLLKPLAELKVRMTPSTQIPDPARIENAGEWYYLDHISSGLSAYDSDKKKFKNLLSESWRSDPDGTHTFTLRKGARFHDGTLITVKDVIWSIKRQLLLKTSTHFPLWDYIVGCEKLKSLEDDCEGLQPGADREIVMKLKVETDSFYLQVASPETGIWAASDMDPKTASLHPTKFSGPYYVDSRDDSFALLKRNENSPISAAFPNSPRAIRIQRIPLAKLNDALANREVDLVIRSHSPLGELDWNKMGIQVRTTMPSTLVYFFGLGTGGRPPIGRDFLEAAWRANRDPLLTPSETYLPFTESYGLTRQDFLSELPEHTAKTLRVFCPESFFSQEFLDQLQEAARAVGTTIEFSVGSATEWLAAFNDPKATNKYDYIMSLYAASERYPAMQLRYLTKKLVTPPIDLKQTESPDSKIDRNSILRDYQKWLLNSRQATPLYFTTTFFLHQKNIDLGEQPSSDAEIELWRVQEKNTL